MTTGEDHRFVEEYRPLVQSIARRVRTEMELTCELDDLIAFGFKGLIEARTRFDPSRGVQFNTFAYYRIRGSVLDGVRTMAYLPRRAYSLLRANAGADLMAEEVATTRATHPGEADAVATASELDQLLGRMTAGWVLSALGQNEDDPRETTDEIFERESSGHALRRAVAALPERERALIEGHYFAGKRFDEVAVELGVSKSWASRLHTKAMERLKHSLTSC